MKKKVIAYLHTHWDREWYREFEVFRLRLIRVFDNVLNLLEQNKIPCFYFDGQTSAIEDYLELNPEKENLVKELIKKKKLFIGPFYTLVDEFMTDEKCFRKNLEIGIKYSKSLGCEDFIGYFADTFGHSKTLTKILKDYGIDKAVVWRGCGQEIPSEFLFNGIKTVNILRGYFNDIFSSSKTIKEKSDFLQKHLDKIAEKSSNILLMPIGADHLGIEDDITEQIREVNDNLEGYKIELASPFKYFDLVRKNFKFKWEDELRDNSRTFILQGCYSARMRLKQYSAECSYKLDLANKFQEFAHKKYKTKLYTNVINYAYKLLLQNLAHDGICGCSTDLVHKENEIRYEKVLQIANTIIKEILLETGEEMFVVNVSDKPFSGVVKFSSEKKLSDFEYTTISNGVEDKLYYNTQRIPVTEDFKDIYNYLAYIEDKAPSKLLTKSYKYTKTSDETDLIVTDTKLENSKICITFKNGNFNVTDKTKNKTYTDMINFVDFKDNGDTYNFGPVADDKGIKGEIISTKVLRKGKIQCSILAKVKIAKTSINLEISLNKNSHLINLKFDWENKTKNHLLQIGFNLKEKIAKTNSLDMGELIERNFDADYDIRKNLPKEKGIEVATNTAPMQGYITTEGFEIATKGLFEYEVSKNTLLITLLRATGIISNPKNPARLTPAGPPIIVNEAQQLGKNSAELFFGFGGNAEDTMSEVYPYIIMHA